MIRGRGAAVLYDALIFADLPGTVGRTVPTDLLDRMARLLFTGTATAREVRCDLDSGAVLAGCYAALRHAGARGIEIRSDADEVLDVLVPGGGGTEEPLPWPRGIPERWVTEPCVFRMRAPVHCPGGDPDLAAVAELRFTPTHLSDGHALCGAIRVAWSPAPHPGQDRIDPDGVRASLATSQALRDLGRTLREHGNALCAALGAALGSSLPAEARFRGTVHILHGIEETPSRFAERVAGLPSSAVQILAIVDAHSAWLDGRWPALDDQGVPGWVRRGRFAPSAEEADDAV